jgi:hypothetical protein
VGAYWRENMATSKSLQDHHNQGQEDASSETHRSTCFAEPEERRAYKDGYYNTLGQKDYGEGKNRAFCIQSWLGHSDDDQANVDAYNNGREAARTSDSGK